MKPTIMLLLFWMLASALQASQPLILDLSKARSYALEHNKNLKSAGYALDKSQLAVREAIANGLPQVNASMDYSNALGAKISIRFAENMPASEIDIKPQSNMYVNVNQLLFSGNYIVGVQLAKLGQNLSRLGIEKTEIEVLSMVTDAYYMAVVSRESKKVLEQNLSNLNGLFEKTSAMQKAGLIEKTDLDQLSVQLNALHLALASAKRQHELSLNLLRLHIGAGIDMELEITDTLEQLMEDTAYESIQMQQFNPEMQIDYRMMQQQEYISRKMVDMQRAHALPTLAAFYRYTYKLLKPDFDMTPANMVGLQLNIPIISSGVRHAQTQQAKIDLKTLQNNKSFLADQLMLQDKQLRFNLANAVEAYAHQQNNIEVARRVNQSYKNKYAQGMISGLDLINADNNYLRAESDHISAAMQALIARLQLEKLYGKIE